MNKYQVIYVFNEMEKPILSSKILEIKVYCLLLTFFLEKQNPLINQKYTTRIDFESGVLFYC